MMLSESLGKWHLNHDLQASVVRNENPTSVAEVSEKIKTSYTAGGNVKLFCCFGKQGEHQDVKESLFRPLTGQKRSDLFF